MIHNGIENHFFTVNSSHFVFLRARKKNSHGSPSNINQHTLSESHAKFGAFIRPVTVISLSHLTNTGISNNGRPWGSPFHLGRGGGGGNFFYPTPTLHVMHKSRPRGVIL